MLGVYYLRVGDLEGVAKDAHGRVCVAADLNGAGI